MVYRLGTRHRVRPGREYQTASGQRKSTGVCPPIGAVGRSTHRRCVESVTFRSDGRLWCESMETTHSKRKMQAAHTVHRRRITTASFSAHGNASHELRTTRFEPTTNPPAGRDTRCRPSRQSSGVSSLPAMGESSTRSRPFYFTHVRIRLIQERSVSLHSGRHRTLQLESESNAMETTVGMRRFRRSSHVFSEQTTETASRR